MGWIEDYEAFKQSDWKPTKLSDDEEKKFFDWFQKTELVSEFKKDVAIENNIPVEKVDLKRVAEMVLESKDYDYRGAWKAGVGNKEEKSSEDNRIHWLSSTPEGKMLKSPTHETAWKEFFMRWTKIDPDKIGIRSLEEAKQIQTQVFGRTRTRPLLINQK